MSNNNDELIPVVTNLNAKLAARTKITIPEANFRGDYITIDVNENNTILQIPQSIYAGTKKGADEVDHNGTKYKRYKYNEWVKVENYVAHLKKEISALKKELEHYKEMRDAAIKALQS